MLLKYIKHINNMVSIILLHCTTVLLKPSIQFLTPSLSVYYWWI